MRHFRSRPEPDLSVRGLLKGGAAGFLATAPMSASMLLGWMLLPEREKYPLAPRLIAEQVADRMGLGDRLDNGELAGLTVLSHFGYGAFFGAVYALYKDRLPIPASLRGALAGLALWIGSYLGWLPAVGILRPATRHPWRRNLLMIVAHLVWGVTLGVVMHKLTENE